MLAYMTTTQIQIPAQQITDVCKCTLATKTGTDEYWHDAKAMVQLQGEDGGYRALLVGNSEHYDFAIVRGGQIVEFTHEASALIGFALERAA